MAHVYWQRKLTSQAVSKAGTFYKKSCQKPRGERAKSKRKRIQQADKSILLLSLSIAQEDLSS